jgi:hypothetical protein
MQFARYVSTFQWNVLLPLLFLHVYDLSIMSCILDNFYYNNGWLMNVMMILAGILLTI